MTGIISDRLSDVLAGREENYLLPFYWQHGNHTERIPAQIERIYNSGCRALCVESRPHPDFGGPGWWRDMDIILAECEKRGMKVWILDDKHFPTGYANGYIKSKYPHLRQWELIERHVDVVGPLEHASILMNPSAPEEPLVGVYMLRRDGMEETVTGEAVDLTDRAQGGFLYLDIPAGVYRVFFLYRSRRGSKDDYIDPITAESAHVQIEAVYEPHWAHYARYFGNTLAGFFSDEPEMGNRYFGAHRADYGFYDTRVGQDGMALPWNADVLSRMTDELGYDPTPYLGELWYFGDRSPALRLAYMNAVTHLYQTCFCRAIGDWCRERGVEYIGHIIEDWNNHTRLGHSVGHYFRGLDGQDMSGIDIVLHQVMPSCAHHMTAYSASGGVTDPEFFHYVLGQLAASLCHQVPRMQGRAMCEVFGAYGWGEGSVMMKWLMDFLLVRGVNHFVPHAFSPDYPDPDCPPHFGAEGHDPQYDGFSAIMRYVNKAAHLLTGGKPRVPAAILYHAEGEWMNLRDTAMLTQKPAKELYDAHINYDILCTEVILEQSELRDGRLYVNGNGFGVLVIPYAPELPAALVARLNQLTAAGFPVLYADGLPAGAVGRTVPLSALADAVRGLGICDVTVDGECPLLRTFHIVNGEEQQVFMLFNEDAQPCEAVLHLPASGEYARLRLIEDAAWKAYTADGVVAVSLAGGQSEILVFGSGASADLPGRPEADKAVTLKPTYTVETADADDLTVYRPYCVTDTLFDFNAPDRLPGFAGKMRYTFSLLLDRVPDGAVLDLGQVGENARLMVNGRDAGIRVCAPYAFPVGMLLKPGENVITVTVSNTLGGRIRDGFSYFLTLQPSGLLGAVRLLYKS
ncbi:MAG: glycosyl transferase family 2 [Clostridia bacterium]|nr:glycosyl transferase family 2 [Clostridia bacterium]